MPRAAEQPRSAVVILALRLCMASGLRLASRKGAAIRNAKGAGGSEPMMGMAGQKAGLAHDGCGVLMCR